MLLSSLYHIFCCHSEQFYRRWLSADLLGVSLSLLAIYISGIYYAFSCVPFWLNFYLVTVGAIFATAIGMQILPMLSKQELVTEENFHLRLVIFGGWAAYGVIPTFHWALLHGGMTSPVVGVCAVLSNTNSTLTLNSLVAPAANRHDVRHLRRCLHFLRPPNSRTVLARPRQLCGFFSSVVAYSDRGCSLSLAQHGTHLPQLQSHESMSRRIRIPLPIK